MSIYSKLQAARVTLQSMPIKKSGNNKFAGYTYMELGDFIPAINNIFADLKLCGVISFTADNATLRIVDTEAPDQQIEFTSPMSSAALKGCHDVQNLGAVQTYLRRYLYVMALEIVEHDALDSTTGAVEKKAQPEASVLNPAIIATLESAADVKLLAKAWSAIDVGVRSGYAEIKDKRKAALSEAA